MIADFSIKAYLPFDISEMEGDDERTVATILSDNLKIDYPCGELYCYTADSYLESDLKAAGISWDSFYECIKRFEERGFLSASDGEYYFAVDGFEENLSVQCANIV